MAFDLKNAVIHYFEKNKGSTEIPKDKIVRKKPFDPKITTLIALAEGIHSLLGKKGNNVVWGQFDNNARQGNFPASTETFVLSTSADNFETLTNTALDELMNQAALEGFATGGHTLFAHYTSDSIPYMLIANIKQRNGLALDSNYIPIESVDIDMSKVLQACRINLARYSETLNLAEDQMDPTEGSDKTYLCFISKGRDSEASAYFIKALGCTPGIASTRATNNAIDIIEDYFRNNETLKPYSSHAKDNVIAYLTSKLEAGEKATLNGLHLAACGAIPPDKTDLTEKLDLLVDHLNNEESKIPDEFTVNKGILEKRTKIKGKSTKWAVQFDRSALSTSVDSIICYNSNEGTLTFSDIPTDMKESIEAEISSRQGQH